MLCNIYLFMIKKLNVSYAQARIGRQYICIVEEDIKLLLELLYRIE